MVRPYPATVFESNVQLERGDFVLLASERLAALVPAPRFNLTRYFGVLAPAATFRSLVTPQEEESAPLPHPGENRGRPSRSPHFYDETW